MGFSIVLLLICLGVSLSEAYKKNVVFSVAPGDSTCFIKNILHDKVIEVMYKVIDSTGEDTTISFDLLAPRGGGSAVRTRRWPAGAHVLDAAVAGAYRFCFDNGFDLQAKKTIYFDINIRPKSKKHKIIHGDVTLVNTNVNGVSDEAISEEEAEYPGLEPRGAGEGVREAVEEGAAGGQPLGRYQDISLDAERPRRRQMFFIVKGSL